MKIDPAPIPLTANEQRIKELLDQGLDMFKIAFRLHMGYKAVRDMIFEIRKKEAIANMAKPKLSNEQRGAIYASQKKGASMHDLAQQYGVSVATVSTICAQLRKAEEEINAADMPPVEDAPLLEDAVTEPVKIPHEVVLAVSDAITRHTDQLSKNRFAIRQLQNENEELQGTIHNLTEWLKEVTEDESAEN